MEAFIFNLQRFAFSRRDDSLIGTNGNDQIEIKKTDDLKFFGGGGNDTIFSHAGNNISIDGGTGNDILYNSQGSDVTIRGGDGDDSVVSFMGENVLLDAGNGSDTIFNTSTNATIIGGKGDDSISNRGGNALYIYNEGDGNDTISGYSSNSTLQIAGNYSSVQSGDDLIVKVGDGSIKFVDKNFWTTLKITSVEKNTASVNPSVINLTEGDDNYTNHSDNVSINALAGNDYIFNSGSNVTIDAGDGNDDIDIRGGSNLVVNTGAGNDSIWNKTTANVTIDSGDDNDLIQNSAVNVSISGGNGDDLIQNFASNVTINAGKGNDSIFSNGDNLHVYNAGDGNDKIYNWGANDTLSISGGLYKTSTIRNDVLVYVGDGCITLGGAASLEKINIVTPANINVDDSKMLSGTTGNDSLYNSGSDVSINGNGGDDYIENGTSGEHAIKGGDRVSINTGDGNDYIANYEGDSVTIDAGDGDNHIWNVGIETSINSGDGNDTVYNGFSDNSTFGLLTHIASTLHEGPVPYGSYSTLNTGAGDDYIANDGDETTINAGSGSDTIYSRGNADLIELGDGNDSIFNDGNNLSGNSITVDGGAGDDTIWSSGSYTSLSGGDGNDLITNHVSTYSNGAYYPSQGNNVTINGGKGNDTIETSKGGNTFIYNEGDGNDIVTDVHSNDTLVIGGGTGTYSKSVNADNDLVITVGDGAIIFRRGIYSTVPQISGIDKSPQADPKYITLSDNSNRYTNTLNGATIDALGGNDSIYNSAVDVSINLGAGNDTVYNWGENVSVASIASNITIDGGDGNDYIDSRYRSNVTIDGDNGDDEISNYYGSNVSINGGDGNDTIESHYSENVTIDAGAGDDTVWVSDGNATVNLGDGNDSILNYGSNTSINAGDGDDTIRNSYGENVTIEAGTGDDSISNNGDNVSISGGDGDDTVINYGDNVSIEAGDGNDSIQNGRNGEYGDNSKIDGGAGSDVIENNGRQVTINAGSDNDTVYNYGIEDLIDAGDGDDLISLSAVNANTIIGGKGNDTIYGGSLGGNVYIYKNGDGNDVVYNVTEQDVISIESAVFATYDSGNDLIVVVGDSSITFKDAAGKELNFNTPLENNLSFTGTNDAEKLSNALDNATINALGGNDSIRNYGDNVSIDLGDGKNTVRNYGTFTTINAGDGDDEINNRASDVTINAGDGDDEIWNIRNSNVSINAGDGDDQIDNYEVSNLTINAGTGNDYIWNEESTNLLFEYADGDGNDTIEGFNETSTLKISGEYSTVTSGDDVIVKVGDGSILLKDAASLESVNIVTVETPTEDEFSWTFTGGKVTYRKTNGDTFETVFTLTGLKSGLTVSELEENISVDGTTVTLSKNVLGTNDVTISDGFTLALSDDVPTPEEKFSVWTLSDTTATLHDTGKSEGYTLTNSKTITYSATTVGKTLLTVKGLAIGLEVVDGAIDGLTVNGKILTVTPDVVGENLSISSGYKVVFASGNYGGSKFTGTTGKDTIEVNGSGLEIDGGKGNDTITSKNGGNVYLFASTSAKDVVIGYGDDDTIKITDDSTVTASVKNNDVIIKAGTATMTLKNAATGTQVTVVDENDDTLIDEIFYADRIVKDNSTTLTTAFNSKTFSTDETVTAVDGSATSVKFSLNGGDENNTLTGGKGNNFINGGAGDNILTGGKGNDTFAAGNGVDTITDYEASDKISLTADISGFSTDGDDVILNFDDNSLTIQNAVDKKITFLKNGKSSTEIFTSDGKNNTAGTSITLGSSIENYTASAKMLTIDGGLTDDVFITGNTKANKIFGGDGDDTIFGGKGNDTLSGGNGSDIFIYEAGKDVITDYETSDKISLGAAPTSETLTSKGDVVLKFGSGVLTIKNVAEQSITFADDTTKIYYSEKIIGSDGVTLQSTFKDSTFAATDNFINVDASATTKKLTLTGNNDDNTLIGGKGANLIDGGKGDDLLIGNGGADTFVYSSGDDTIGDYGKGSDKISLTSAMTDFDLSGDDVIIGFDDGSLTIADGIGKKISFVETVKGKVTTNVNIFAAEGIYNSGNTALTLAADTSTFDAANYSKVVTIDGGLTDEISIVGNTKNNLIFAGDLGSTINGGGGTDTLWGGDGADTFIHASGKDVIYDFGDEDALQFSGNFTTTVKDNSISFKIGTQKDAITLKDYSATSFNINGNTYAISGNTLTKK